LKPRARGSRAAPALATLARFAVAGARGDAATTRRAVLAVRAAGVSRVALQETALMLVLYAGYPAALEALRASNQSWPGRPRATREGGPVVWRRRGVALCRRVYGPVYSRLMAAVRRLHPDLAAWMVDLGYGRVLSRPGLSARDRETITVAVLAATGRERQLVSHLLGATRVGASAAELRRALRIGASSGAARAVSGRAWRAAFGGAVDRTRTTP
jgi:AhpD family alkylhydroperoxidase